MADKTDGRHPLAALLDKHRELLDERIVERTLGVTGAASRAPPTERPKGATSAVMTAIIADLDEGVVHEHVTDVAVRIRPAWSTRSRGGGSSSSPAPDPQAASPGPPGP